MREKNCWEIMKCGREISGANTISFGVCPVSLLDDFYRINDG